MTNPEALRVLGLEAECDAAEVRAAFRAKAADLTSGRVTTGTIDALRTARDVLNNLPVGNYLPCTACHGRGRVQMGFMPQACMVCGGTGEKHA